MVLIVSLACLCFCGVLQQTLRALAVMCLPNEIRQDGHYHYHALLPTLPCLAMLVQAGNRLQNKFISQQVMHKKKVTMACVQDFLLSRLLYTDHGVRLIESLCLAILLHCVTASARGAGVMC